MRTFAYCARQYQESTRRAAGVEPLTAPPYGAGTFESMWLEGYDLLYFALHGEPGADHWTGDENLVALTARQIRTANLSGAVVFAANCYLADEDNPMLAALLDAGARYVVAGKGVNYSGFKDPLGAALLGLWLRRLLAWRVPVPLALSLAWHRLLWELPRERTQEVRDTLGFRAYKRVE